MALFVDNAVLGIQRTKLNDLPANASIQSLFVDGALVLVAAPPEPQAYRCSQPVTRALFPAGGRQ